MPTDRSHPVHVTWRWIGSLLAVLLLAGCAAGASSAAGLPGSSTAHESSAAGPPAPGTYIGTIANPLKQGSIQVRYSIGRPVHVAATPSGNVSAALSACTIGNGGIALPVWLTFINDSPFNDKATIQTAFIAVNPIRPDLSMAQAIDADGRWYCMPEQSFQGFPPTPPLASHQSRTFESFLFPEVRNGSYRPSNYWFMNFEAYPDLDEHASGPDAARCLVAPVELTKPKPVVGIYPFLKPPATFHLSDGTATCAHLGGAA